MLAPNARDLLEPTAAGCGQGRAPARLVILLAKHIFRIGCSVLHTLNDITAHNNEIRWCYLRVLLGRVVISVSFQRFK